MKVRLPKDYKKMLTAYQMELAKSVIAFEKEYDDEKSEVWIEYAMIPALNEKSNYSDGIVKIIETTAEVARNNRIWNEYGETEDFDVYITGVARTIKGYIEVSAYLSDIHNISYEYSQTEYMHIRYFTES